MQIAAAIIREKNKILICQRGVSGSTSYLWEFPGGKIEHGESATECVVRECKEELDIEVSVKDIFDKTQHVYPEGELHLTFFNAVIIKGQIKLNVHLDYQWVEAAELEKYDFCPADIDIIKKLRIIV